MNVGHHLTAVKGSAAAARGFLFSRCSKTTRSAPESALSSHVDEEDGFPRMVDVGEKTPTRRTAIALSKVRLPPEAARKLMLMTSSTGEVLSAKGPVLHTAVIAGTQGAKKTSDLLPFCHPVKLDHCKVRAELVSTDVVEISCRASVTERTGVEMEALVGASIGALAVYDMLKGLSHDITIEDTKLIFKSGGKRFYDRHRDEIKNKTRPV
eukprot:381708_1